MATAFRLYLAGRGLGTLHECVRLLRELELEVDSMNASRHRLNLWARVLEGTDDVVEEMLDEGEVVRLTGGVFPVVFFNATYDADRVRVEEWEALERRFGLQLFGRGRSRHNTPF